MIIQFILIGFMINVARCQQPKHYWAFNNDLNDSAGKANLKLGKNAGFTFDRFGNKNQCLNLNNGYVSLPPDDYLSYNFTISYWFYLRSNNSWTHFVQIDDLSMFSYLSNTQLNVYVSGAEDLVYQSLLSINTWYHIVYTLSKTDTALYLNGNLIKSGKVKYQFNSFIRTGYFGWIGNDSNKPAFVFLDEIKLYNVTLTPVQVANEYSYGSASGPSTTSKTTTSATTAINPVNLPQLDSFNKIVLPKNHWSFNGNYNDSFGNADLVSGENFGLTSDRYGNPNSALSLNNGYMIVPGGQVYFSGDFSFISWIFWRETKNWARIIDFGNGAPADNIQICSFENRNRLFVGIAQGKNDSSFNNPLITNNSISLNTWYHVAYVQSGNKGTLYLNAIAIVTNTLSPPLSVVRNSNFIGKSNWLGNDLVNAVFDEMKIFDVALSEAQVIHDYRLRPTTLEKRK